MPTKKTKGIKGKNIKREKPFTTDEAVELNDLIAEFSLEDSRIYDIGAAEGVMTALNLYPQKVPEKEWMDLIFEDYRAEVAEDGPKQKRLRELLSKRYKEIGSELRHSQIFEPFTVDSEDDPELATAADRYITEMYSFVDLFLHVISEPLFKGTMTNASWAGLTLLMSLVPELWDEKIFGAKGVDFLKKEYESLQSYEDVLFQVATGIAFLAYGLKGYEVNPLLGEVDEGEEIEEDFPTQIT